MKEITFGKMEYVRGTETKSHIKVNVFMGENIVGSIISNELPEATQKPVWSIYDTEKQISNIMFSDINEAQTEAMRLFSSRDYTNNQNRDNAKTDESSKTR